MLDVTLRSQVARPLLWAKRSRLLLLCVVGAFGWVITFATLFVSWAAEIDEPYYGWSATVDAAWLGAAIAIFLAVVATTLLACIFASLAIPLAATFAPEPISSPRVEPAFRGMLITGVYCVIPALVIAPWQALVGAAAMFNPADPPPVWADNAVARTLGSTAALGVLLAMIVGAGVLCIYFCLQKPKANRCARCNYDTSNLLATHCPECNERIALQPKSSY